MKPPKPGSFGHRRCLGKKAAAKETNRVSAKCAIKHAPRALFLLYSRTCLAGARSLSSRPKEKT
jgi:hypothetical protein